MERQSSVFNTYTNVSSGPASLARKLDGFLGASGEVVSEESLHSALFDDLHASLDVRACAELSAILRKGLHFRN